MLSSIAIYLTAAIVCVALMKRLGFAAVLGYLLAGILIGPWGWRLIDDVNTARQLSQFGVVLLLFVIGLELQPSRLWALRRPIFGLGGMQMLVTGICLALLSMARDIKPAVALVIGLGLAMSSTAFVLQLLAEKHELGTAYGRASFAILLFQDIAVIPLLALVPLLATGADLQTLAPGMGVLKVLGVLGLLLSLSRFVLRPVFSLVARTEVPELFTATALLVVVGTSLIMEAIHLSVTLGAFLAGVILADSEFRHEIEARIAPFEGLLLGLFFIAVGMAANLGLVRSAPSTVFGLVSGLILVKFTVMVVLARLFRMPTAPAIKLGAVLSQGGEFAFILFGLARAQGLMSLELTDTLNLVVTLSMAVTPIVYGLAATVSGRFTDGRAVQPYDAVIDTEHIVVIAGLGRFGQIAGRVLRALDIPYTALEINPEQVELVRRFGSQAYYGDASNLALLQAAKLDKAKVLLVAIDDPDASVRTIELVRTHFPNVEILARARNRQHVYRLLDLGVKVIERELFHSSLMLTEHLLVTLGLSARQARRAVVSFRRYDEAALQAAHAVYKDEAKLIQTAKEAAAELRTIFEADPKLNPGKE